MTFKDIIYKPFNGRMKDLTGQRFGRLVALQYVGVNKHNRAIWKCKCDCGNEVLVLSNSLLTERTLSCGCYHKEIISKDITGQRFGKLIALERTGELDKNKKNYLWRCKCDCGKEKIVTTNDLLSGNCQSCGCLTSRREFEISNFLKEQGYNFKTQYIFPTLKDKRPLRFDFAILDNNNNVLLLIEYFGIQHYNQNDPWYRENIIQHDKMKQEYCKNHNIPLLILNKDNYDNINNLIKEKL